MTYVGHSTFLIQVAGINVLIDPVYANRASPLSFAGPRRARAPGVRFDDLPPISLVLLSHNHYDHCDIGTLKLLEQQFHPAAVTPPGNGRLRDRGVSTERFRILEVGNPGKCEQWSSVQGRLQ